MGIRKHISHRYRWPLIHPCPCVTPITSVYIYLPLQAPGIYTPVATILCNAVRCLVGRYAKDALDTRYIFSTDCLHLSVLVTMLVTRAHTFSSHDTTVWNSVLVKINSLIRGGTAVDALLSHCLCQVSHWFAEVWCWWQSAVASVTITSYTTADQQPQHRGGEIVATRTLGCTHRDHTQTDGRFLRETGDFCNAQFARFNHVHKLGDFVIIDRSKFSSVTKFVCKKW